MRFLALAHHTGVRLAEIGFLLILFAGVLRRPKTRSRR